MALFLHWFTEWVGEGETFKMWGTFLLQMLAFYKTSNHVQGPVSSITRGQVLCHNLIGVLPEYPYIHPSLLITSTCTFVIAFLLIPRFIHRQKCRYAQPKGEAPASGTTRQGETIDGTRKGTNKGAGGVGVMLLQQALLLAARRGYRQVLTIATHGASQKISERLGFVPVGSLLYLPVFTIT